MKLLPASIVSSITGSIAGSSIKRHGGSLILYPKSVSQHRHKKIRNSPCVSLSFVAQRWKQINPAFKAYIISSCKKNNELFGYSYKPYEYYIALCFALNAAPIVNSNYYSFPLFNNYPTGNNFIQTPGVARLYYDNTSGLLSNYFIKFFATYPSQSGVSVKRPKYFCFYFTSSTWSPGTPFTQYLLPFYDNVFPFNKRIYLRISLFRRGDPFNIWTFSKFIDLH